MPNCDWGKPCSCSECVSSDIKIIKKCCRCNENAVDYIREYKSDRKGLNYIDTIGFCPSHYTEYKIKEKDEQEQIAKARKELEIKRDHLLKEFTEKTDGLEEKLIAIKILDEQKNFFRISNKQKIDPNKLHIKKVGRYWKICENKLDVFKELELENYFYIEDPRK